MESQLTLYDADSVLMVEQLLETRGNTGFLSRAAFPSSSVELPGFLGQHPCRHEVDAGRIFDRVLAGWPFIARCL